MSPPGMVTVGLDGRPDRTQFSFLNFGHNRIFGQQGGLFSIHLNLVLMRSISRMSQSQRRPYKPQD